MGDTGSQFLGVLLGAMGIMYLWNDPYSQDTLATGRQFGLVCLAYIVPLVDTTFVVIKRLADGRSPFVGGKDHTTHALAMAGFTDQKVGLIFIGINLVSLVLVGLLDRYAEQWHTGYTVAIALYFLTILLVFRKIQSSNTRRMR
jgi:UDP-GlcNAc:undecaprenyl-phosphate GlcNAc-1-phosphate transferase